MTAQLIDRHCGYLPPIDASGISLLPCPFCAGTWVDKAKPPYRSMPVLEELAEDMGGGWRVSCYGCYVQTWNGLSKDEAITTWNRRRISSRPY